MSSSTTLTPRTVRRLSVALVPAATALLVVGVLPAVLATSVWLRVVGVVVAAAAVLLLGIAVGLHRLTGQYQDQLDARLAEAALDAELIAATAGVGVGACGDSCSSCVSDCAVKTLPRA